MTDRITKPITAMKEYGRKPYLVTKDAVPYGEKADYRYMMDTVWHKQQDNEQIVVQSVKKKPYQNSDYQVMEGGYDFPIFTIPRWNFNFDFPFDVTRTSIEKATTETEGTGLRWLQCPTTVSASKTYTIIVQNSSITTRSLIGGRTNSTTKQYLPTAFTLTKATSNAKGMVIYDLINKGSTTWITLGTESYVSGRYYLNATDGDNVIKKLISTSGLKESTIVIRKYIDSTFKYYKLRDEISGGGASYTAFTINPNVFLTNTVVSHYLQYTTSFIDSVVLLDSYAYTLVNKLDDTVYESVDLTLTKYYEGPFGTPSATVLSGVLVWDGEYKLNDYYDAQYNKKLSNSYGTTIMNNNRYYYGFSNASVFKATDDYSAVASYEGATYNINTTGTYLYNIYFIDDMSYVIRKASYSASETDPNYAPIGYKLSGMFSGESFDYHESYTLGFAVQFGSL